MISDGLYAENAGAAKASPRKQAPVISARRIDFLM